ncbi:MAG: sprT domain-containing protein [Crocinitomicaceae bacterium]|nr:sprT domain-containing protein [Crocinitomicaceae bacterium]
MINNSKYKQVLSNYLPEEFIPMVLELLGKYPVQFKIVKPRKTKLGDFRSIGKNGKPQITVNGDLNPYAFLITTIHEFAHLFVFKEYGRNVAPHGKEWKATFSKLLTPAINSGWLPDDITASLNRSIENIKASSCTDIQLQRVLLTYDEQKDNLVTLESLPKNSIFALNNKVFKRLELRRTRFMCEDIRTKRRYLVNALAQVKEIEHE